MLNFKNIESQIFNFEKKINCFVGKNGAGKTNILDAIYYLSFSKSYFNPIAGQNIRHNQDFFVIEGEYIIKERTEKILCSLKRGQKKVLKRNDKVYERFSDHIGQFPLVIISPADRDLIVEGSETRRKFIDGVISQQDKLYLQALIAYNKVLSQRNALLKFFAANRTFDELSLNIYNEQLIHYGTEVYEKRIAFLSEFSPIFLQKHKLISNENEVVSLRYKSQLNTSSFKALLEESIEKDKVLQYTTVGVHKDDLNFEIENYPIKKFGSQGQQKSYLIALKLAQFEFIKAQSKITPIVLLDDIFDKLDEYRVAQIVELVTKDEFGQIFITDTHFARTQAVVKQSNSPYEIFKIN